MSKFTMAKNYFFVLVILAVIAGAVFAVMMAMMPVDTEKVCGPLIENALIGCSCLPRI